MTGEMTVHDTPAKGPVCGCLERVRRILLPQNGKPATNRETGAAVLYVIRMDKDQPYPPSLTASFCPFCGEAYE